METDEHQVVFGDREYIGLLELVWPSVPHPSRHGGIPGVDDPGLAGRKESEEIELPAPAVLKLQRQRGYGSVPGLEDEELADPAELERQVFAQEWGPILALPCRSRRGGIRPAIDEWGHLDWGAFGTWDFERLRGPFDAARYKADKLREQLRNDLFMLDTVRERLSSEAREQVRTRASRPEVDLDDFADADQRAYAKWLRRVRRLSQEIHELREFSRRRRWGSEPSAV